MPRTTQEPSQIRAMFSAIAHRYDFLNRVLSLGLDQKWRRLAAQELTASPGGVVLDLACGTGDLALKVLEVHPGLARVVGSDFSWPMLQIASLKIEQAKATSRLALNMSQAEQLPFKDGVFSGATVAFGLRNFADRLQALKEIYRVLKPEAKLVILEFSWPENRLLRGLYRVYLLRLLPFLAGFISRRSAYRYLPLSVLDFSQPNDFARLLQQAGFEKVCWRHLSKGVVILSQGTKVGLRLNLRKEI